MSNQKELSQEELNAIEQQLSRPEGDFGIEIGNNMYRSNIGMITNTMDHLSAQNGERILEIGHGNASHVQHLFSKTEGIHYTGAELSITMHQEAKIKNQHLINEGIAEFHLIDGTHYPFSDSYFDKIFTVNTIYFWKDPAVIFTELARILNPHGSLWIAFACKEFMASLPFVQSRFRLYDTKDLQDLLTDTGLQIVDHYQSTEEIINNIGHSITRAYTIVKISHVGRV